MLYIISGITLTTTSKGQKGLNTVDAKDFVSNDAIPLGDGNSIPFTQEKNWMRSWFGENYEEAVSICQQIKKSL